MLKFVPIARAGVPALFVGPNIAAIGGEYVFECVDADGDTSVRTFHASLPDALQQVVSRMRVDRAEVGDRIDYRVELGS